MSGFARVDSDRVTAIIREVAAEHILPYFRNLKSSDIGYKIGDDPVTIADHETEKALSTRLSALLPGSKTLGEEAFASDSGILERFLGESPVWIIDPIDGTRNFVRGTCEFGVIVALAEQNQTIAGWIYDPTSNEVIAAEKGAGAWYNGKKLAVLPVAPFTEMRGFMGDRLIEAYNKSNSINKMPKLSQVMSAGSHEYPQLVVDGPHFGKDNPQSHFRASLYYATPWDDAAGVLIHAEAGGYAALWNGETYRPSVMHKGLGLMPDRESWLEFRDWCRSYCELP